MRVLLLTPPMVQFNTAYPAVPVLAAFLRTHGFTVAQEDLSLGLALRLFSEDGLDQVLAEFGQRPARGRPPSVRHLLGHAAQAKAAIAGAVAYLQGQAPEWAQRLAGRGLLPEGPRFAAVRGLMHGEPVEAIARHRASLFLDEIADAVRDGLDPRFELARYAERLAADAASFTPMAQDLAREPTLMDRWLDELAVRAYETHRPDLLGLTVPFPGTVYGAFRIAGKLKALAPGLVTVLGGGYVNTELRALDEPRVFDWFDYVTYDDGELPLLRILDRVTGGTGPLVRTRVRRAGAVVVCDDEQAPVLRHRDRPTPDFSPVPHAGYLAMAESPNRMHRLWSERPWLKLTLAHGCYWHRCAFCDTSLDYIRRYDPADAETIVGWMEQALADTGLAGFHFVDEAAPPALLGNIARRILARGLAVEWWANIRFERHFTPELASLLKASGCLALTGGLESAHDRLLALMDKGITTAQAAQAMRALAGAGILVHAYLIYGYPTQTAQETIDALGFVRSLFAEGAVQSAYWHRFALTHHSPAFRDRGKLGLRILDDRAAAFSRNEIPFDEPDRPDPGSYGEGLRRAVYNFMHGVGLELDLRSWFDVPMPRPSQERERHVRPSRQPPRVAPSRRRRA